MGQCKKLSIRDAVRQRKWGLSARKRHPDAVRIKEICRSLVGAGVDMAVPLDQEKCTHQGAPIQRKFTLCSPRDLAPRRGPRSDAMGEEEKS